jgi:hypothetical protein
MFRNREKPNLEQVKRLETEIRKGREALTRHLSAVSGSGLEAHTDDSKRRSRLYEVFTAYGAPIGRA